MAALTVLMVLACLARVHAHDPLRPELDGWYSSLRNPKTKSQVIKDIGCCSKDDCHETEAEIRGTDWWARIGTPVRREVPSKTMGAPPHIELIGWDLGDWVKIPVEAVLDREPNKAGSAVICHSIATTADGRVHVGDNSVFCFIRPNES